MGEVMADDPIQAGEFNAGMKALREAVQGLAERVAAIESLNQAQLMARIEQARSEGIAEGERNARLSALEKRMDKMSSSTTGLMVALAAQLLWWVFSKLTGGK